MRKNAENIKKMVLCLMCSLGLNVVYSQQQYSHQSLKLWSLRDCIDYALENNIDVKSSKVSLQGNYEDLMQAKASRLPSLNLSSSQSYVNQKELNSDGNYNSNGTYSGNYAISTGVTIYNGGKLNSAQNQKEILYRSGELSFKEAQNNIEIAVTQAYLNILYANESLKTTIKTIELSQAQFNRAKALYLAGSISSVDLAQIEAQLSSDKYQLAVGENNLAQSRLSLKQLLELGINESFDLLFPDLDSIDVLEELPGLNDVYTKALFVMPQIENSLLQIESAKVGEKIASAEMLPSVTMSAAIGTGNISGTNWAFFDQLNNKLNENIGLSLSVPIFNKRSAKTSVNKAKLQTEQAVLNKTSSEKNLLSTIESLYQDAKSSQSRYKAATDKLRYSQLSYNLVNEQFNAGMKNTVELLTEKQNFISAQQEQIEAKYQAVLSIKLLRFYQNQPIEL
ncbi:MAG: TolC family protein [Bacteroidales bacterium]